MYTLFAVFRNRNDILTSGLFIIFNVNNMAENNDYYDEAFSRNIGLLTKEQQYLLKNSTVAIGGLGGVGGIYATTFARLGFGNFHIADLDIFETINMNRQACANVNVLGRQKTEVTKETIQSINPDAKVTLFSEGINEGNIMEFLDGVDIALDGIDFFTFEARRTLFNAAREKGIYIITAAPVGFGSSVIIFDPKGMSFDEYFDIHDGLTDAEKLVRFGVGITPSLLQRAYFNPKVISWKNKKAPSLVIGTLLCANLVSTFALKILFGQKVRTAPSSLHFDAYVLKCKKVWIPFGNRNPIQILKRLVMTAMLKSSGSL